MPKRAPTPCRYPGCGVLTATGLCPRHEKVEQERQRQADAKRGTAAQRGYNARWRKERDTFLREYPLCAECARKGELVAAKVVDHIVPHKGDMALFWDRSNWQSLCIPCHSRKTAKEDGGFGNRQRRPGGGLKL